MSKRNYEQIQSAKAAIHDHFEIKESQAACIGIVLGSGLGSFADEIQPLGKLKSLPFSDISNFPTSSVEGHDGRIHYGLLANTPIFALQGRIHRYEGYSANDVVFPIRVLAALGVKKLVLTNAAGCININFSVGDLMLITDHINLTGDNPLIGQNDERLGPRFFDMGNAYSKRAQALAHQAAAQEDIKLREGCYLGVLGPTYETPAEVRMMRTLGADAVGMSTVFETIAARHMGLEVLGISCLTNMAAGVTSETLTHSDVQETAHAASIRFNKLLSRLIPTI